MLLLSMIRPHDVATYMETLQHTHSAPGVKQQLAAVRMLFDWLIIGQVAPANPASAARPEARGEDRQDAGAGGPGVAAAN
jgi:site-specific recombinase XerD